VRRELEEAKRAPRRAKKADEEATGAAAAMVPSGLGVDAASGAAGTDNGEDDDDFGDGDVPF
jgi:hypothetical protein